jgi:hypothetical protein
MRVAMALDVTGSMADDGKMPAMQTAAKSLIDQLSPLAKNPGDIYISVVPFAKDVNFGSSYYNQTYMDWSVWEAANNTMGTCSNSSYTTKSSCLQNSSRTWTHDRSKWTGCVTDRTQDYDTRNTPPTSSNAPTMIVPEEYVSGSSKYCKVGNSPYMPPIMPLSYDWSALKTMIGTLQPTGNTNQGIGLAWGWLTLGTGAPFNAHRQGYANYTYKEAIILLSDGLNTQNRWYSNASQIDARQKILCDNAKAANITIYTVQVNTGGIQPLRAAILRQRRRQVLRGQASQPDLVGVQFDRTVAGQAAHREITAAIRRNEKGPAGNGRAFLLGLGSARIRPERCVGAHVS